MPCSTPLGLPYPLPTHAAVKPKALQEKQSASNKNKNLQQKREQKEEKLPGKNKVYIEITKKRRARRQDTCSTAPSDKRDLRI